MTGDSRGPHGVVRVNAGFLNGQDAVEQRSSGVIEEDALTLDVIGVGQYTLMWTPAAAMASDHAYTNEDGMLGEAARPEGLALAIGFALSEGLIECLDDIQSVAVCANNPKVVRMQLGDPEKVVSSRRNVVINSSCGICGPYENLQDNTMGLRVVGRSLRIRRDDIGELMRQMAASQPVFHATGGSHAAAIFDCSGTLLAVAEDLGRHNALDKVIGLVLLQQRSLAGCGVVLSSRLSLEMVTKAVRAGLEIMLAVSAPTSLAIQVADRFGVTLCGFVRDDRATVYTHPDRILS